MNPKNIERARIAGNAWVAKYGLQNAREQAAKAHRAYRESFKVSHKCKFCPLVEVPPDLSEEDKELVAQRVWDMHWARLRMARDIKKAMQTA